jgi:hypothetical protein
MTGLYKYFQFFQSLVYERIMPPKRPRSPQSGENSDPDELSIKIGNTSKEVCDEDEEEDQPVENQGITNLDEQISAELMTLERDIEYHYCNMLFIITEQNKDFWLVLLKEVGADALCTLQRSFKGTPLEPFVASKKDLSSLKAQELFYYMLKTYCGIYNKENSRVKIYELYISLWTRLYSLDVCMGDNVPLTIAVGTMHSITMKIRDFDPAGYEAQYKRGEEEDSKSIFSSQIELIKNNIGNIPDVVCDQAYYFAWRAAQRMNQLVVDNDAGRLAQEMTSNFLQECLNALGSDLNVDQDMDEVHDIFQDLAKDIPDPNHPLNLVYRELLTYQYLKTQPIIHGIPEEWKFPVEVYLGGFAKLLLHSCSTKYTWDFGVDAGEMARSVLNFLLRKEELRQVQEKQSWNNEYHIKFLKVILVQILKLADSSTDLPSVSL